MCQGIIAEYVAQSAHELRHAEFDKPQQKHRRELAALARASHDAVDEPLQARLLRAWPARARVVAGALSAAARIWTLVTA